MIPATFGRRSDVQVLLVRWGWPRTQLLHYWGFADWAKERPGQRSSPLQEQAPQPPKVGATLTADPTTRMHLFAVMICVIVVGPIIMWAVVQIANKR
jgi:hypothetical protein